MSWKEIRYSLHIFGQNKLVVIGACISIASIIIALLSHFIVNPNAASHIDLSLRFCWNNPIVNWHNGGVNTCPSAQVFPLGTDGHGRNLLQMIVLALPLDLQISFEIVASALVIGVLLGAIAGYASGIIDEVILRVTDIFFAIPSLILAIMLLTTIGRTITILTFAVLAVWWPTYVRLTRSVILAEKQKPYVESLRTIGASRTRILFRHILPNSIYPVLVQATLDIGGVMIVFSGLMFLGFSPNPLLPELGNLVNEGIQNAFVAPWLIIFPGLTILIVALGFNLLGDGIRDVLDPRLRR